MITVVNQTVTSSVDNGSVVTATTETTAGFNTLVAKGVAKAAAKVVVVAVPKVAKVAKAATTNVE